MPAPEPLHDAFAHVRGQVVPLGPDPWEDSPYRWIRTLQTRTRGMAGELVVERWLTGAGMVVGRAARGGGDRVVNGHRVEVKLSTQWSGGGFRFSQLRDQTYSHLILLGVQPQRLHAWCVPKAVVLAHATGQHTGGGAVETRWFAFDVDDVPAWLSPYGGTAAAGLDVAAAVLGPDLSCCPG